MNQFHAHLVLVLLSFIVNLAFGSVSLAIDPRHRLNRSYSLMTFGLAFWSLMKLAVVLSPTHEEAFVFTKIGALSWCFLPALYLPIVYALIRAPKSGVRRYVPWAFTAVSAVLALSAWFPGLLFSEMRLEEWGYTDSPGWVFSLVFQPYLIGSFVYMIVELVVYSARARSSDERVKGIFALVALLVPLVGGTVTNVILPAVDVYVFETAIPLTTVNAVVIAYAAMRYRLLSIRVDYVSKEIVASIDDALMIVNADGRVGIVNGPALDLLGRDRSSVVGVHVNDLLENQKFDEDFKKNVAAKKTHVWHVTLSRQGSAGIDVDIKASELRNDRRKLVGYVFVVKR